MYGSPYRNLCLWKTLITEFMEQKSHHCEVMYFYLILSLFTKILYNY